jgi:hypothetical protein
MNIDIWLQIVIADAEARELPDLKALLESLAQATRALRAAQFVPLASAADPPR